MSTRDTNTFKSNVFYGESKSQNRKVRDQNTFKSTLFGSATPNRIVRYKLGGNSKGTETLFGADLTNYEISSNNTKI
jgi:hypothetical protein